MLFTSFIGARADYVHPRIYYADITALITRLEFYTTARTCSKIGRAQSVLRGPSYFITRLRRARQFKSRAEGSLSWPLCGQLLGRVTFLLRGGLFLLRECYAGSTPKLSRTSRPPGLIQGRRSRRHFFCLSVCVCVSGSSGTGAGDQVEQVLGIRWNRC